MSIQATIYMVRVVNKRVDKDNINSIILFSCKTDKGSEDTRGKYVV